MVNSVDVFTVKNKKINFPRQLLVQVRAVRIRGFFNPVSRSIHKPADKKGCFKVRFLYREDRAFFRTSVFRYEMSQRVLCAPQTRSERLVLCGSIAVYVRYVSPSYSCWALHIGCAALSRLSVCCARINTWNTSVKGCT